MVARVLVKIDRGRDYLSSLLSLREWCRKHTRKKFHSYSLSNPTISKSAFVVFEFDCEKEAMKFRLLTGM